MKRVVVIRQYSRNIVINQRDSEIRADIRQKPKIPRSKTKDPSDSR
jgi:hypothetical protein